VGKSFRPWYDKEVDPLFRRVLAAAKTELDPKWMLNPGLIVDKPAGLKIVG
ncbi:FAD-linked oxidase C-terminal domain-containing protein, partial [Acinetobacter baumannii]